MAELKLKPEPETYECVGVEGVVWDCYWSYLKETEVDNVIETYCRFDKSMCKPCEICRRYVRRDKIDDYIRHLLEELDYYYKLP